MYHPRLYGEHYDMGLKYGSLLKEKVNFKLPILSPEKKEFGISSIQLLEGFYPEAIEEIDGFAKGINDSLDNVAAFLLSLVAFDFTGQCSVFAYKNKDSVIVGRNYDMPFAFKKFTESSLIAPKDKYAYIAQSDVFIGRSDGINEKGVFIGMSFVNSELKQPGVSFHFIVRRVLEEASNTKEAVEIIKKAKVSSSNNFLIADKAGAIAIVESSPEKSNIINLKENENFLHITNEFKSSKMKNFDIGGIGWSKSAERYTSIENQLQSLNSLDIDEAKIVLSNPCVCLNLKKEKFGTIWSVASNLKTLSIERAESQPKTTNFKPETRLDWWLKKR